MTDRKKILIVDDSPIVRELVQAMLEEKGHAVIALSGPFGFADTVAAERPDLVLMDVGLPALAGNKVVEFFGRRASGQPCPIVLFSDRPEQELRNMAKACGAAGYLRKSSDLEGSIAAIDKYLQNPSPDTTSWDGIPPSSRRTVDGSFETAPSSRFPGSASGTGSR